MAGIMIAHSVLNGGPGIPCLHMCCYIMSGDRKFTQDDPPLVTDIPVNVATMPLIQLIIEISVVIN